MSQRVVWTSDNLRLTFVAPQAVWASVASAWRCVVRDVELCSVRELVRELATIEDATRGESAVEPRWRPTGTNRTIVPGRKAAIGAVLQRRHLECRHAELVPS